MKVSLIGIGAMGQDVARHVQAHGFELLAYDRDEERCRQAASNGLPVAASLAAAVAGADVHLVIVATDAQSESVTREIMAAARAGSIIVILATNSVKTMQSLGGEATAQGFGFVDAPVCYGRRGAREGTLVSLCGGDNQTVATITPVLNSYSRAVYHIGPTGAGQLGKTCNNMLHWAACVANYEVLLLAKRYGIDAQQMRETLLDCPGQNGTLKNWDDTHFTWHEKDMDVALDLAQSAGLALPLFGQVDQLVKRLDPGLVRGLLHGEQTSYLGIPVQPLDRDDGGLN